MNLANYQHASGCTEYYLAKNEIANSDPKTAYMNFLRRLDANLAQIQAKSAVKMCCGKGCWYCCDIKVDVKAPEALVIAEYIRERVNPAQQKVILEKAKHNAAIFQNMEEEERLAAHLQCPLLIDNCCMAYEVRPANCRIYHSIDFITCKKTYEEPENLYIPRTVIEDYYDSGNEQYDDFCIAAEEAGYDDDDYELSIALVAALMNRASLKRYKKKKRAFV